MADCLFCKICNGDIPTAKLYEDDEVLAFKDINPQAPVHFLVIPKKHIADPVGISSEDGALLAKMFTVARDLAKQEGVGDGFRLVFNNGAKAGQTVFHIHMHVLGGRNLNWPPG